MVDREKDTGNLSIKKLLSPTKKKHTENNIEIKTTPFSQEELIEKWRKFSYSVKIKDLDLYSTLNANSPILKDNFRIELVIQNTTQETDINNKKPELLGYLRKQLNNMLLDLDLVINKSNVSKSFYTEKDKYKKLVEKNPKLDELRKKFGLSF